jgi:predicted acetyltransferase
MREIRLLQEGDWEAYAVIAGNAYPGVSVSPEVVVQRIRKMQGDPIIHVYGLFVDGELQGVMRLYDFQMRLLSAVALVGGIGGVAVDLRHKKERVAYEMVQFYLQHYREKGACLAALYPFRPDFYRQMGFGYGRKLNQYRLKTASLPRGSSKAHVDWLRPADQESFVACYNRLMARQSGLMVLFPYWLDSMMHSAVAKTAVYRNGDQIEGFMTFQFEKGANFLHNELVVRYLMAEHATARMELLTFLHDQADQVETTIFHTFDDAFHLAVHDPRDDSQVLMPPVAHQTNTQGVGLMYRVIDVPRLFAVLRAHDFGGQTCRVRLELADSFLPVNAGAWVLDVQNGRAQLLSAQETADVTMRLDIADFSSLVLGVVTVRELADYHLLTLSDGAYLPVLHRLFFTDNKPICLTPF